MPKKVKMWLALSGGAMTLAGSAAAFNGGRFGWLQPTITPMGREIDSLYVIIMWIVIALFVLTQGTLLYTVIAFRQKKGRKAASFHGSTKAEIIWTMTPALILAILTILSGALWARIRINFPKDKDALVVQVFAEQFAWNFRYAGPDGVFGTADDVVTTNDLRVPVNRKVVLKFSSKDVIHSFFMPEARVKQDCVPGLQTRFWFQADQLCVWDPRANHRVFLSLEEYNRAKVALDGFDFNAKTISDNGLKAYSYTPKDPAGKVTLLQNGALTQGGFAEAQYIAHPMEIGCAQLCGTLHFGMRGEVSVQTPAQFEAWLASAPANPAAMSKWNTIWDRFHADFNKPNL